MSNKIKLKKMKESSNIIHEDTKLIMRSVKEKVVIGKYNQGKIDPLTPKDIETCKTWKFEYDKDLVGTEQDEVGDNGEEEEEDEEEEEEEEVEQDEENEEGEENEDEDTVDANEKVEVKETATTVKEKVEDITVAKEKVDIPTSHGKLDSNELCKELLDIRDKFLEIERVLRTINTNLAEDLATVTKERDALKNKFDSLKMFFN